MESPRQPAWTPRHDLALLYLALMHGADAEIDAAEHDLTAQKLHQWFPSLSEDDVRGLMGEVMLVYVGTSSQQMLDASVASLGNHLPKPQRVAILNDLADIASADGIIVQGEASFIQQLAALWGINKDTD